MSYFIAGFKADTIACAGLENALAQIVPGQHRTEPLRVGESPSLVVYGHRKVIPHLVARAHDLSSWVAVVGTPLVQVNSERDQSAFVHDFFRSPSRFLRDTMDGNFAVFAYDGVQDRFLAATDFNNTTPIFYAVAADGMLFSSHELALAKLLTPEIDLFGFSQAVQLGVTWSSHTRFRGIAKLLPCELLTIDKERRVHLDRYWSPQEEDVWSGTFDETLERWGALLRESVSKIYDCSNRGPVLADFTAGEDSRLVLAQCHALGIPFTAHAKGSATELDVIVAERAAQEVGFALIKRKRHHLSQEQLLADASTVGLGSDGYLEFSNACEDYATNRTEPLDDYSTVKYCGVPGGEAFRGSYYLRGKALFPSRKTPVDYKFFTRMKYLLDYQPGLLRYPDARFLAGIHQLVTEALKEVADYPVGTQIDHLLRAFQTCSVGLMYKDPLYLPLATGPMTRSVYSLPPRFKRGGRLTRACTERLFPELASIKTQSGVPTIRRTMRRQLAFMPEYVALAKKIANGAVSRLFKWKEAKGADARVDVFKALLNNPPYREWFSSASSMVSGAAYEPAQLDSLLGQTRAGTCRQTATVGRIIGQELALRWVYCAGRESRGGDSA